MTKPPEETGAVELPPALAGMRLDRAVSFLTGLSRSEAARLVAEGGARLDGEVVRDGARRLKGNETVVLDDRLTARRAPAEPPEASADVPFRVVYEDDELIVVDKPVGVVVHPGAGIKGGTLVSGLLSRYPELAELPPQGAGEKERPGIVHRLDKETSGLLVVARSPAAHASLTAQLKARSISRRYRALLVGRLEAERGVVDAPIGRAVADPTAMAVDPTGREARTRYEARALFTSPLEASDAELSLETGRTHQIRVHMAAIGHPVLGDRRYGGRRGALPVRRPMLHAARLELVHPSSGEQMAYEAPLPEDFEEALRALS